MSKLVDQLESAIKLADWPTVCAVFKKMTGRTVNPPIVEKPAFNWKTAKKKELYDALKEVMGEMDNYKNYTIDDLRDMANIQFSEDEPEEDFVAAPKGAKNTSSEPEYTYIPENKKPLNGDIRKLNPRFTEFPSYDDEGPSKITRDRPTAQKINASCRKCHSISSVHPNLVTTGYNGEKIYYCPKCS